MGRTATMFDGVRPSISFASLPTASTFFWPLPVRCTATTDGSFETMPLPLTKVRVVAVPRSIARSLEKSPYTQSNNTAFSLAERDEISEKVLAPFDEPIKNFVEGKPAYVASSTARNERKRSFHRRRSKPGGDCARRKRSRRCAIGAR